jgi:hypothetical protein
MSIKDKLNNVFSRIMSKGITKHKVERREQELSHLNAESLENTNEPYIMILEPDSYSTLVDVIIRFFRDKFELGQTKYKG